VLCYVMIVMLGLSLFTAADPPGGRLAVVSAFGICLDSDQYCHHRLVYTGPLSSGTIPRFGLPLRETLSR
jgi:hypothetical protein